MDLHGRPLSIHAHGEDVELLQAELRQLGYSLPTQETSGSTFGRYTQEAVVDFQHKHHLRPTGIVDEQAATRINQAVEARQRQFLVQGTIRLEQSGSLATSILVRAFDRDLRSEELLGETISNEQGYYRIAYTAGQFLRAEKRTADLIVRAVAHDGTVLGEEGPRFQAGPEEVMDFTVQLPQPTALSEYEKLVATLEPVLRDIRPAELTDDDIAFLLKECADESLVDSHRLNLLSQSGRLAAETKIPAEFFYGLAQQLPMQAPYDVRAFIGLEIATVQNGLEHAIAKRIIPSRLGDRVPDLVAQFGQLQLEHGIRTRRTLVCRLIEAGSEEPIEGLRVRAFNLDGESDTAVLGVAVSNRLGIVEFAYTSPIHQQDGCHTATSRNFRLPAIVSEGTRNSSHFSHDLFQTVNGTSCKQYREFFHEKY